MLFTEQRERSAQSRKLNVTDDFDDSTNIVLAR